MTTTATISSPPPPQQQRWSLLSRLFTYPQRATSNAASADIITTHTSDREGDTKFFAFLEINTILAFFRRDELVVHPIPLSKGNFTSNYPVVGINPPPPASSSSNPSTNTSTTSTSGRRRQEVQNSLWISLPQVQHPQPRYVIKHLSASTLASEDPKVLSRAARELVNDAKYLARLSAHPNIVTLRGLTQDAFGHNYLAHQFDDFFLLRDRVCNYTLQDKIYREWKQTSSSSSTMDYDNGYGYGYDDYEEPNEDLIPMKANYAFQIAKALRYCHEKGVLYRDLKPSNIGFSLEDPHCIQLMEFGLARDFSEQHSSTQSQSQNHQNQRQHQNQNHSQYRMTLAGTRRYLAGEVLTSGSYTWKSDVYSWAMVYYEMCTESKPYQGLTAPQHQQYVCCDGERPSLVDYYLPEAIDTILHQSWHPHLNQRWSMSQVCDAMLAFLMQIDVNYYQQQDGDFLFDLDPTPIHVESWTEEEFGLLSGNSDSFSTIDDISVAYSINTATDLSTSYRSFYVEEEVAPPVHHYYYHPPPPLHPLHHHHGPHHHAHPSCSCGDADADDSSGYSTTSSDRAEEELDEIEMEKAAAVVAAGEGSGSRRASLASSFAATSRRASLSSYAANSRRASLSSVATPQRRVLPEAA